MKGKARANSEGRRNRSRFARSELDPRPPPSKMMRPGSVLSSQLSLPANPAPRTARLSTGSETDARTTSAEPRRGAATAEGRAARRAGEARVKAMMFFWEGRARGEEKEGGRAERGVEQGSRSQIFCSVSSSVDSTARGKKSPSPSSPFSPPLSRLSSLCFERETVSLAVRKREKQRLLATKPSFFLFLKPHVESASFPSPSPPPSPLPFSLVEKQAANHDQARLVSIETRSRDRRAFEEARSGRKGAESRELECFLPPAKRRNRRLHACLSSSPLRLLFASTVFQFRLLLPADAEERSGASRLDKEKRGRGTELCHFSTEKHCEGGLEG